MPSDNNKEDIYPKTSNNSNKKIRSGLADTINSNNNRDIDQQRPIIPDSIPQNEVLSELSQNF